MRVLEFHFNPKQKPDLIFDSFCFEPENSYEKRAGSLYMAGLLRNALPQNTRFLNKLTKTIEEKFYGAGLKGQEQALRDGLKTANDFLEGIAKKGDVSWLGHLSFAVLSLKNLELNFTKVGEIKILLLRRGHIIDIDKRLKFQDLEPYPLRVFPNIVSGKLAEDDILLVLTRELFSSLQSQGLMGELAGVFPFDEKKIKEVFHKKNEAVVKMSGVLLLIHLGKEVSANSRQIITPFGSPQKGKKFSLKIIFPPIAGAFKKTMKNLSSLLPSLRPNLKKKRLKIPRLKIKFKLPEMTDWKKNLILISALTVFLLAGAFVSKIEEKQKLKSHQTNLNQIQKEVDQAESLLILKGSEPALKKNAADLLLKSWDEISSLVKMSGSLPKDFRGQVLSLRDKISSTLFELNKLVKIEEPELISEIKTRELIPQNIAFDGKYLYLFSPYSQNLLKISPDGNKQLIPTDRKFNTALNMDTSTLLFYSKPNKFSLLENGGLLDVAAPTPPEEFALSQIFSFKSNLYFYDKKNGDIQKARWLARLNWSEPEHWLSSYAKKPVNAKAIAVNGSIWVLTQNNEIDRYYGGYFQETLKMELFPYPEDFIKLLAIPPYLYILEPNLSRIVILDRAGDVVKQFQSLKFDNLLDFAVSENGRIIYLLNGQKVYKIKL